MFFIATYNPLACNEEQQNLEMLLLTGAAVSKMAAMDHALNLRTRSILPSLAL